MSLLKKNVPVKTEHPECQHCASRKNSLFHFCHLHEIEGINDSKSCAFYKRGQVIFHEDARPLGLYCIQSGKIKVYRHASDGKEQIIRLAKPGDFIGYSSLLTGRPYPVSAEAIEDSFVCVIPKNTFAEIISNNKQFSESIIKLIGMSLENSVEKMADLAYKPVRGRLAEALLFLNSFYKDERNPEGTVTITREDLASLVGTVKETAIRMLSEFKEEHLIETNRSEIQIKNVDGLVHISQLYD